MKITIKKVDPDDILETSKVIEFAASFGHQVDEKLDTFVALREDTQEWLGFLQVIPEPPVISAWKRPGKDTIYAIKEATKFFNLAGTHLTLCSKNSPFYPFMEKLGFQSSGMELFFTKP